MNLETIIESKLKGYKREEPLMGKEEMNEYSLFMYKVFTQVINAFKTLADLKI